MKLQHKVFEKICRLVKDAKPYRFYNIKEDQRTGADFKLVFFCGSYGINYLNASMVSVHKNWKTLPEILIVTDGTPIEKIKSELIAWPKKVDFITWKVAADYFDHLGNTDLVEYANKDLWGKKFISILYCASQFPTLYSDTDILWFATPDIRWQKNKPVLMMSQDLLYCYSDDMLNELRLNEVNARPPLNAGLIFAFGDYSSHPQWPLLCNYLAQKPDNRTEQTSFAVLNNYFNRDDFFPSSEVLIKVDDGYKLNYTPGEYPSITARHYVNIKSTTFWRDFILMLFKRRKFHL